MSKKEFHNLQLKTQNSKLKTEGVVIPMVDLKRQYLLLKQDIDKAIQGVLDSTRFILGPEVASLEREVAGYFDIPFAIGVASGTDALLLALRACGIGKDDEVITTPFTFIATVEAITYLQATPVFVDIAPDTFNMDTTKLEQRINSRTRAIIPVHLFGHPVEMEPLSHIAEKYGLKVIEDCAQSFGAGYKGRKVGTIGNCGCFSFFPSKNLGGYGDGGMVITQDEEIAAQITSLRNHGSNRAYEHRHLGYNSRLDEIQAAILRIKLRKINEFNHSRRRNADGYRRFIKEQDIILPREKPDCFHVYHQFSIRLRKRERVMAALSSQGIASAIYYPKPLHRQEALEYLTPHPESLPIVKSAPRKSSPCRCSLS